MKAAAVIEFARRSAPALLALSLFGVYLSGLAPDLTWAHDGADGGDLITAAATGGVPHPGGYPSFLLLAHLFQLFPVGTIAYRTNLMSAVFTALTALLAYELVVGSPASPARDNRLAGMIAGYVYGLAPLAWSQAVITEVYALHTFFAGLILWLLVGRPASWLGKAWLHVGVGLTVGLGAGNHLTTLFLLPPALLAGVVEKTGPTAEAGKNGRLTLDWRRLALRLGGVGVGLLVYAVIPVRAASQAPVNWGYAVDLAGFWWLISGAFYRSYSFSLSGEEVLLRLQSMPAIMLKQFGVPALLAGLYQLLGNFSLSAAVLVTVWTAAINMVFSLGYATTDSYVYLLPFLFVFAVWTGWSVGSLGRRLAGVNNWLGRGVSGILAIACAVMAVPNYSTLDLSGERTAEKFFHQAAVALPPRAIVVTGGDRALFSLWYYHFVFGQRPDIAVLGNGLLPQTWYHAVLYDTYPDLNIVRLESLAWHESIARANQERSLCIVVIDAQTRMSLECYRPFAQQPDARYISILQPLED